MKLRILDNSIRLRLGRSELRQLLDTGIVERRTRISPLTSFVYALHLAPGESAGLRAAVGAGRLDIYLGAAQAKRWGASEEVGLEGIQEAGDEQLQILVEKDFPCRHTGPEDESEKFVPGRMQIDGPVPPGLQHTAPATGMACTSGVILETT